jgi:SAM-dependent methyltransferase
MPSVERNITKWNEGVYGWKDQGEEWSKRWGSSTAQWYGWIYPRVQKFFPASTLLELAPGFGRWTQFLLPHCDRYIGVDVSSKCVDACTERFNDNDRASFFVNDGSSLPMVADSSVDFAFSFDSFVHVEGDTISSYLVELARVLKPDGAAFVHHSNFGAYHRVSQALAPLKLHRLPDAARMGLECVGLLTNLNWRAATVSAPIFVELCEDAGMKCVGQELVNWAGGAPLTDAISLVTHTGSVWDRPNRIVKNRLFGIEARAIRRSAWVYGLTEA